jgi:uncharacterized protein YdaL
MLKIKDNVDLKELEKFGFEKMRYVNSLIKRVEHNIQEIYITDEVDYFIDIDTKEIQIRTSECDLPLDNTIYDLIKADLVEKI